LRSRAESLGLDAGALRAERVLNWGGFGTHSFRVGDGDRLFHVKLTTDQVDLRRWMNVQDCLEREYRGPRILEWVDISGTPIGGLLFEHIEGETWDVSAQPELLFDLIELLGRLHADQRLALRLGDGSRSLKECWRLRYRDQYEEDLKTVRGSRPAFVTDARLRWMEEESRRVLALADNCQAFDGMTSAPCHWDLWPNNVMTEKTGGWWVLDWDSLATGDEAEDYATLVWPFFVSGKENWRTIFEAKADRSCVERVDLHLRAITLDYAIDVLADWAECDVPEWREQVRTRKDAEHSQYLDWYRSRWD
jgi:hypothetical protein